MAPPFEFLKVPKAMIVTVTAKLVAALAAIPFRTGAAAGGDGGARAAERRRRRMDFIYTDCPGARPSG